MTELFSVDEVDFLPQPVLGFVLLCKYAGEDDIELFEVWLKGLLRWLRVMRLGGPQLDEERVQLLGQFLKSKAAEWYNDTIDSSLVRAPQWTFKRAICALFERFLHHANAGTAADKFHTTKYNKSTGVQGLWDSLVKQASRMPQRPDEYTFARKFVEALPPEIGIPLFRNKNVTVEGTAIRQIYHLAVLQEHNNRQTDIYRSKVTSSKGASTSHSTTPAPSAASCSTDGRFAPTRPSTVTTTTHQLSSSGRPIQTMRRSDFEARRTINRAPFNTASARSAGPSTNSGTARDSTRAPPKTATFNASRTANSQAPRSTVASNRGCFKCGKLGHFSKDCDEPPQTDLRAARVLDDVIVEENTLDETHPPPATEGRASSTAAETTVTEAVDAATLDEEYREALDGSQYDSAEDTRSVEDYIDEDDIIYLASMRRVVEESQRDPSVSFAESGMSAVAWELAQWRRHLQVSPDAPYHIDNVAAQQLIDRGDWHDNAQGSRVSPTMYSDQTDDIAVLHGHVNGLRNTVAQLHGNVITLHRELVWARNELLDAVAMLQMQTRRQVQLLHALDQFVTEAEPLDWRSDINIILSRFSPVRIDDRFDRIRDRFRLQDSLLEDMPVDSDSELDYADDPSPLRVRERAANQLPADDTPMEYLGPYRTQSSALESPPYVDEDPGWPSPPIETGPMTAPAASGPVEGDDDSDEWLPPLIDASPSATEPTIQFHAMHDTVNHAEQPAMVTRSTVRRPIAGRRPLIDQASRTCLTAYVTINGLAGLVLLDSGSTTDSLSPDFARVARVPVVELENPAVLQLGCVGSRSRISHGTTVPVLWGKFTGDVYFDIVNLDRYDAVLGTPFMRKFGVCLDFKANAVRLGDSVIPALPPREEEAAASRKRAITHRPALTTTSTVPRSQMGQAGSSGGPN